MSAEWESARQTDTQRVGSFFYCSIYSIVTNWSFNILQRGGESGLDYQLLCTYVNDIVLGIMCICAAHVQPVALFHLLDDAHMVPAIEQLQKRELRINNLMA